MTRHRPERGSSKTLVAVSIDPVSSSMKLSAARDGTSRTRRGGYGMAKVKRRTRRVDGAGWKVDGGGLEGGGLLSFHDPGWFASLLTRRSVTTRGRPRIRPLLGRVPLHQCLLAECDNGVDPPPPSAPLPSRVPGVSRPGNLSRITLIKRFSPSVVAVHGHLSTPPRYREFH